MNTPQLNDVKTLLYFTIFGTFNNFWELLNTFTYRNRKNTMFYKNASFVVNVQEVSKIRLT